MGIMATPNSIVYMQVLCLVSPGGVLRRFGMMGRAAKATPCNKGIFSSKDNGTKRKPEFLTRGGMHGAGRIMMASFFL